LAACLFSWADSTALAQTTPIYEIQYTDDPSGASPLLGQVVTVEGVVTAAEHNGFYVSDAVGPWSSIYVYTRAAGCGVEAGDAVSVTGKVAEYHGLTEIKDVSSTQRTQCTVSSSGNPVAPLVLTTGDLAQEQYEGVLVRVEQVEVTTLYGITWIIDDGSGGVPVYDRMDYRYAPLFREHLDSVTGTVSFDYGHFAINPRSSADIVGDPGHLHYALRGDVVTMNDAMEVLSDHYVEIDGERIAGITPDPPAVAQVVQVDGLIFPGLIDAHNHPQYNVFEHIPFGQLFTHREEWRAHALNDQFEDQLQGIRDYPTTSAQVANIWKLAEVRAMAAGTTMIQGSNLYGHDADAFARPGMGINNVGRFPSHALSVTFPLAFPDWPFELASYWNRFNVHLSEGTNQDALDEFYVMVGAGMLDWRTSIIHGIPYGPTEWALMASAGAHLIWSPKSNWVLYGATANVPQALDAGVNVALSVDWTASGSRDLLAELQFAQQINLDQFSGALSAEFLARAVTRNAALALGLEDRIGRIAPGYQADLAVLPGNPAAPYDALLSARPRDVKLTVVGGRPSYGDPELMDQFTTLEHVEDLVLCDRTKRLALAVDHHVIPESERSFAEVMDQLVVAYQQAAPRVCDFLGIDPCKRRPIFIDGLESGDLSAW
jgi:hypothetical protein